MSNEDAIYEERKPLSNEDAIYEKLRIFNGVDLILIRGLPGSGKSTLATKLANCTVVSADDYFTTPTGEYNFDPAKLKAAHDDCQERAAGLLLLDGRSVVVANTFSRRWEMQPYMELPFYHDMNIHTTVVDLFDAGLTDAQLAQINSHGVPESQIAIMRGRWEHDWRNGNITAPWLRA